MGLPKVETPKYDLTLPISGKTIKYRPFVVREQKILLQANEMSTDPTQMSNAIVDILKSCTFDEVDILELPVADVEMLTLNIRGKSVGESIDLTYRCTEQVPDEETDGQKTCNTKLNIRLDIPDVTVDNPSKENKIVFNSGIGVVLKELTYGEWMIINNANTDQAETGFNIILASIESVFDEDQIYGRNDFTVEELGDFLNNLTADDFEKIAEQAAKIPTIQKNIDIKCPSCGAEETIVLRGLDDFLE